MVKVLLKSGADETIVDTDEKAAWDVVAVGISEELRLAGDFESVCKLLAKAPADRAWRRRSYLVLCRAHPDRVQQAPDSSSELVGTAQGTCNVTTNGRGGCNVTVGGTSAREGTGADRASTVWKVLGLQAQGIFRTIVGYLIK